MLTQDDRDTGTGGGTGSHGLEQTIDSLMKQRLGLVAPSWDADLIETGVLDSMAIVELVVRLEETFGIRIGMEDLDLDSLRSVTAIATLVRDAGATAS